MGPMKGTLSARPSLLTTTPPQFFFLLENKCVSTPWTVFLTQARNGKPMFSPFVNVFFYYMSHSSVNSHFLAIRNLMIDLCLSLKYCLICQHFELPSSSSSCRQHRYPWPSCRQHRYPWPSLATSPYHSSPPVGLLGYILCPHIAAVCKFGLVVLLLLGHMWESIGVRHLRARPCFSSSVRRVWLVWPV